MVSELFRGGVKPVLVTGASGFIGSHLARRLAMTGVRVVGTCSEPARARRLHGMPDNFTLAALDLREPDSFAAVWERWEFGTVFHLAAEGVQSGRETRSIADVNTLGAFRLAETAAGSGVDRFVYCGSALEYEPRDSPINEAASLGGANLYGATKAAGWLLLDYLCRTAGLPLVTVRPFTVFGPGEGPLKLIPWVIGNALCGEPIELTEGLQVRDYVYVGDVVDALLLAVHAEPGAVFNIGTGPDEARTVRSIVETILDLLDAPRSLCRFGEAKPLRTEPSMLVCDPSLAKRVLGWKPETTLIEGLTRTIEAFCMDDAWTAAGSRI